MSIDLTRPLECPFCNFAGDAVIRVFLKKERGKTFKLHREWIDVYFIICTNCRAEGPVKIGRQEAITAWNQAPRRRLLGG
ncbi:MAG: hypothetical protein GWN87_24900 [Desulfuromonadales bacterium]|nr:hypothetical protein [Desulfuromonadales bacterium]